ncbi:hypothetical protein ACSS6W_008848 [Trichoderma asperelloides]
MLVQAPISLDYTLYDLYAVDNDGTTRPDLFYYPFGFKIDEGLPVKFVYNFGLETEMKSTADPNALMEMVVRGLAQRYGFFAGKLHIILPISTFGEKRENPKQVELEKTFSQIQHDQSPNLSFVTSPDDIVLRPETAIAVVVPTDSILKIPHAVDPDTHYELLSKRGLAFSGLPTPPTAVIDAELGPDDVQDPQRLQQAMHRMLEPLDTYQIPFFVKLNQSVSGKGVFAVTSEARRAQIKKILSVQLQEMLGQINEINNHLYPSSFILQDYVPGEVVALSMFVTQKGQAIFNACCRQRFDSKGYWIGGQISYLDQETLKRKYSGIMNQIAEFLHQRGYYGPAGADIVTGDDGKHYTVDLNVRVTGTHPLGPLAGHFTQRGLINATIITEYFTCSRSDFERAFKAEIADGALIICSWVREEAIGLSHGGITIGGADNEKLEKLMARVLALSGIPKTVPDDSY